MIFQGTRYGWSRDDCDKAFKRDMELICDSLYTNKKRSWWGWGAISKVLAVTKEVIKLPSVSGKLNHCIQGAKIYYMSVDYFGADNYNKVSPAWCSDQCAISKGDPNVAIMRK